MITVKTEMRLEDFNAWSGARDTLDLLIEHDLCDTLSEIVEECYPNGIEDTELNDWLWFETADVWRVLGIGTDEEGEPIFED